MSIELRDYQRAALDEIRVAYRGGARSVLYVLPTGGGKTTVFGAVAAAAVERGSSVCIIAHRRELCAQARGRVDPRVRVESVQTLVRRLDDAPAPDFLIIDEAHHAPAGSWRKIMEAWPGARVLGVSATPVRLDGRGLGDCFDAMILGPSARELTETGFLVPADVWAASVPDLAGVRVRGGDWATEDLAAAIQKSNIVGDAVSEFRRRVPVGTAIAFCASVDAARRTAEAFSAGGIPADVLTGNDTTDRRDGLLDQLRLGRIRVLCSVDVVSEGFDLPEISAVILLRPTKSLGLYLQQVGRALRPAPGKSRAVVLDHAGNALRHGLPAEDREWTLDGVRANPKRHTESGETLTVRQCPRCYAIHEPAPICPYCGREHEPDRRISRERAGELRLIDAAEAERLAAERARMRRKEEGDAQTLDDWLTIARERGYDRRWAHIRHSMRQRRRAA